VPDDVLAVTVGAISGLVMPATVPDVVVPQTTGEPTIANDPATIPDCDSANVMVASFCSPPEALWIVPVMFDVALAETANANINAKLANSLRIFVLFE
jgi:hypothetical protein